LKRRGKIGLPLPFIPPRDFQDHPVSIFREYPSMNLYDDVGSVPAVTKMQVAATM